MRIKLLVLLFPVLLAACGATHKTVVVNPPPSTTTVVPAQGTTTIVEPSGDDRVAKHSD